MIVYIDLECRCHTANLDGTLLPIETDFFDGKCSTFIEGYKFYPNGRKVSRPDGAVFDDGMITPLKDYNKLATDQREYERQMLAEYEALIDELYAEVTE